ncbi:MAG: indolepyruvate ferredoxin oxidoreductase family protein, partial [Stellaceae bacterium]
TSTYSHMGGEGAAWIGQAPFTEDKHVFQNLGDGTYSHSGLLAIRAAAVAGVNITYKILYNDAVAMTGGQPVEGQLSVGQIARQVAAEGAKQIVVVTDEPDKYPCGTFAADVTVRHRDELDAVQRELREISGLTILIYDQTCAAEKRRRRKRGTYPDPAKRVFINEAVCEGCGDCSEQSNCVAVKPLETEFGRKRAIDQSSCNKDFSCLKGFCPSFVTIHGGELRRLEAQHRQLRSIAEHIADIPPPAPKKLDTPYNILIAGIGGTGVITIGASLGMAAHLDGKGCSVLDFTGLAQKNGAVLSHVRIAPTPEDLHAVRIAAGSADLVLGCDMVVAASPTSLARIEHGVTRAVVNGDYQPTAAFVMNPDVDFETVALSKSIRNAAGESCVDFVDATRLATALLGDSIAVNVFLLGYALQKGLVPLSIAAIERAIELNGVAIEMNKHALAWGRLAAHDHRRVEALVHSVAVETPQPAKGLGQLVERRAAFLARYQNAGYAARYREFVGAVERAERARLGNRSELAEAVAENLFKLMAYKDEYEVARLYTDGEFVKQLHHQFAGQYRLEFHLAPPTLAKRDPATGELQKRAFGPWVFTAFKVLARIKFLRGTAFDPFGRTPERRMERRLITEYQAIVNELVADLTPANHALAVEIARIPERIRGFGQVKERAIVAAKARETALLAAFRAPAPAAHAAE